MTNCRDKSFNTFLLSVPGVLAVIASKNVKLPVLEVLDFVVWMIMGSNLDWGQRSCFMFYSHESSKGKSLRLLLAWMRFQQTISMWRTQYLINSWPTWSVKWFSKMYFLVFKWASIKVLGIVYAGDAGIGLSHAYHFFFHRGGFLAYWKLSKDEMDWFGRSKKSELIPWLEHLNTAGVEQHSQQCKGMSVLTKYSTSMISYFFRPLSSFI